jgi:hypothetical protein
VSSSWDFLQEKTEKGLVTTEYSEYAEREDKSIVDKIKETEQEDAEGTEG